MWETRKREGDYKVLNLVIKDVMMLFTEIETQKELWTCRNFLVFVYQKVLLSHSGYIISALQRANGDVGLVFIDIWVLERGW